MTYDQDPARWTSSPEEAPEILRGAFSAARNEGPNQNQMRSLALKIAAVSAGSAVAVGAAKATAAGNAAATAATWSIGKLAGVIALAGGLVAGAAIWQQSGEKKQAPVEQPAARAETSAAAVQPNESPTDQPVPSLAEAPAVVQPAPLAAPAPQAALAAQVQAAPAAAQTAPVQSAASAPRAIDTRSSERVSTTASSARKPAAAASARADSSREKPATSVSTSGTARPITEVELLRAAQLALRARPREAYQLTEQHRQLYPSGEFAQERDALAIQALLRAGESEMARDLATAFIKAHPSSPHAHRFRESLGIR